uniref:Bulb-type lectin domain-containing protein n=1 Tax=Quercus lobata TaxID=97700 RepID=A0A7N2MV39_QUELO
MSPNLLPSSIFFLYIFLFCSSIVYCSTRDILKHGEWIIDNGSTLVSAGGMFELGFFTPMQSSSHKRFVGIWYHTWGQKEVWVANRDDPIHDGSTGVFGIAEDGKLKVWDNSSLGREYWSPGLEKSSSTNQIVRLMDSGNLVLSEDVQSAMILWESFKYPTDTFLSGMKMDEKTNLVSWNGSSDPRTGQFTFKQDEDESGEGSYAIKEKVDYHWKSRSTAPLPSPRLQYIKDHCLAATTASASPIRPQIGSLESTLSDLPFCEISSSSDHPRASTRHKNTRHQLHAPPRAAKTLHAPPRASSICHFPPRAPTPSRAPTRRTCSLTSSYYLLTSALADVT